jgi:hypothetical protein
MINKINYLSPDEQISLLEEKKKKKQQQAKFEKPDLPVQEQVNDIDKTLPSNVTASKKIVDEKPKTDFRITGDYGNNSSDSPDFLNKKNSKSAEKDFGDKKPSKFMEALGSNTAQGIMNSAPSALDFISSAATKTEALGRKERNAQTLNLAMKGAKMGNDIGSAIPIPGAQVVGAVAGGLIGTGIGLGKANKAKQKFFQEKADEKLAENTEAKNSRIDAYKTNDGVVSSEKKKFLSDKQNKLIQSKYS